MSMMAQWATPLVELEWLRDRCEARVYAKVETVNPTGSHKDRESAVVIAEARRQGYRAVGCASTGNAAISLSAYAFMDDMPCHIWVAADIRPEKLALIKMFHPQLHVVAEGYEEAVRLSNSQMEEEGIYNANPGSCRAKIVGNAAIGREIAEQIQPTVVICPANNGTHILGVWEGLRETCPEVRMIGAVAPETKVADSIGGFHRFEGQALSQMVKESGGGFVTVGDAELRAATLELARHGFVVEPAAAASVAALTHLDLTSSDVVCCTITGSGMKYPALMAAVLGEEKARLPKSRTSPCPVA